MNLILFTPTITKSSIGGVAALVTRQLIAQGCHVVVVRTESRELSATLSHSFGTWILPWDEDVTIRSLIRDADACIYQIGNHFAFHEGALHWMTEYPGLICLHDFYLGHLFTGWAQSNRAQAESILLHWYGSELAQQFFTYSDTKSFIEATSEVMPMTEWVCAKADAVITHSQWGCQRVMNACAGPVWVVPLSPDAIIHPTSTIPSENMVFDILAIGHVNSNKRIESLLEAIGGSYVLRCRATLRLVGHIEPTVEEMLMALASSLDVNLIVDGEVDEGTLIQAIEQCDVVSCLRWPALEAASGVVVKAMLYGKAVIVTNTGFYAELPNAYTIKIDPNAEIIQLRAELEDLLDDNARVKRLGADAKRWASQTFTSQHYARQVVELGTRMHSTIPVNRAMVNICEMYRHWSPVGAFLDHPELMNPLRIFDSTDNAI